MKNIITTGFFALALCGCAAMSQPRMKETASGYPERVFQGKSLDDIKNRLIAACDGRGTPVIATDSNSITCGKMMSGGQAVLTQLLIGNSYSTTPTQNIKFTFYKIPDGIKVTARQWAETQMAFGQIKTVDLNGNNDFNQLQMYLDTFDAFDGKF